MRMEGLVMIDITGDSSEYELLTMAVELSKDIDGMCVEIGLRRALGTKYIIDAVREFCPNKQVISIDPFGSILYICREPDGPCRLDYDNTMKREALSAIHQYVEQNPVNYQFINSTDTQFFKRYADGVPVYELEERLETKYSMAHLDGPHSVAHICSEIDFFTPRMDKGAMLVIDDAIDEFFDIAKVERYMIGKFDLEFKGLKKGVYRRI